jgi:hypothetical protein
MGNSCTAVELREEMDDVVMSRLLLGDRDVQVETLGRLLQGEFDFSEDYDVMKLCKNTQPVDVQYMESAENYIKLKRRLEELVLELFALQDLNSDGVLQEKELVQLNVKIAMLHYGKDVDTESVKNKYHNLFRERLDSEGRPVPVATFRNYVFQVLKELDPDLAAQEMILEQFIEEARSARGVFHCKSFWSGSDSPVAIKTPGRPQFPPEFPPQPDIKYCAY